MHCARDRANDHAQSHQIHWIFILKSHESAKYLLPCTERFRRGIQINHCMNPE